MDDPVGCSGTLAIGEFPRSTTSQTKVVNGRVFGRILEGDIVFNRFFQCFLGDPTNLAEVTCHELGHTIGLGHSALTSAAPGTDPTMRAFAYGTVAEQDWGWMTSTQLPLSIRKEVIPLISQGTLWDFNTETSSTASLTLAGGTSGPETLLRAADIIDGKRVDVSRAFWYSTDFLQNHPGCAILRA